jgi:repressor LexA
MKPAELAGMLYGNPEATLDSLSEIVKLPVKGFINAGTPTLAEAVELGDAFIRKIDVSGVKKVSGLYCLRISGESLIGDQINNGDDVVIEPFPDLIDGKIYAVKLDNQFVARHVHRENGYVILTSSNGKYEKMRVNELEMVGRIIWSQPRGVKH